MIANVNKIKKREENEFFFNQSDILYKTWIWKVQYNEFQLALIRK